MLKAKDGCCEEAAIGFGDAYIPCNKPATCRIKYHGRTEGPYRMCDPCANHNIKSRGGIKLPLIEEKENNMSEFLTEGCHPDVPHQVYVDDPVEGGSLNSSSIPDLIIDVPLRYWLNSSMNPKRDPEEHKLHYSMGSLIHDILLLGGENIHKRYHILSPEFKDFKTKAAREERDAAVETGLFVIKQSDLEQARDVASHLMANPRINNIFEDLETEQTLIWKCKETGVMCRVRFDGFNHEHLYGMDYKTTGKTANPREFSRAIGDFGYYIQAAMYMEGYKAVFGKELKKFWLIVQEVKQPEMMSAIELDNVALGWGKILFDAAKRKYAMCKAADDWPGYDRQPHKIGLPGWIEAKLETLKESTNNFEE